MRSENEEQLVKLSDGELTELTKLATGPRALCCSFGPSGVFLRAHLAHSAWAVQHLKEMRAPAIQSQGRG